MKRDRVLLYGLMLAGVLGYAQTTIDLRTQTKSVDFSGANSTRPAKTGTTLPAICQPGDLFFKTDAPPGANLFGCSATDTWSVQASGGVYFKSFTNQTSVVLTHGFGSTGVLVACYDAASPPQYMGWNTLQLTDTNSATVTFSMPASGACVVSSASGGGTGSGGVTSVFGRTGDVIATSGDYTFSQLSGTLAESQIASADEHGIGTKIQMFTGSASTDDCAKFDVNGNLVSAGAACGVSGGSYSAGTGISIADSTISVDTATVTSFLTGTDALNFGSIANASCADLTLTVPGAATGDAVAAGWPVSIAPGALGSMFVSAADTITVRLCNLSGSSVDPALGTYRATVLRSF